MDSEELRKKRDELNQTTKALIEEKKSLSLSSKDILTQVDECKKIRDEKNQRVKETKVKRKVCFDSINDHRKQLDEVLSKLSKLESSVSGSYSRVREQLEELSWEYQTGVQSRTKEKELVKEMDSLEAQLQKFSEFREVRNKVHELQGKIQELYAEANVYHNVVLNYAKESEEQHKKMFGLYEKIDDARKKAKELNTKIDASKKDADAIHKEFTEHAKQERVEMPLPRNVNEAELRKKAEKILADFHGGKKITVEELGLLEKFGLY